MNIIYKISKQLTIFLSILILTNFVSKGQTNYYSKSTGSLNLVTSWGTNSDGSGSAPTNFTNDNCIYNIRNNASPSIGAIWTVSGANSKIIVGDGTNSCNFTIGTNTLTSPEIIISSNANFNISSATVNISGNITNNGTLTSSTGILVMNGTANDVVQTISGSGIWTTGTTGRLSGLTINNTGTGTAGVAMNSSFSIQNTLNLTAGTVSGSGTLTLGIGSSSTLNVYVISGILPVERAAYNLTNVTFNIYYGNGSTEYTTGGELPPGTLSNSESPIGGRMYLANSVPNVYSTVKLSRDATIAELQIYNQNNSILRLNGKTLQFSGNSSSSNYIYNQANSVSDLKGLDASVSGSKLKFISAGIQYFYFGNQTFGGVNTLVDIEVSNTNTSGALIYYSYLSGGSGTYTIRSLTVNSGSYLTVGGSSSYSHTINVLENIVNNGTIQCYGNNYNNVINMTGTSTQSISGTGIFKQTGSGAGDNRFSGLGINNSMGVEINQSIALSTSLYLTAGNISTSNGSVITLGNGVSSTLTVYVAANPAGGTAAGAGAILPVSMTSYNLTNTTFNIYYGNGSTEYTTGGELPPGTLSNSESPIGGRVYLAATSGGATPSTVKLSRDATIAELQIFNSNYSLLRLNGKNIQFSGNAASSNYIYNQANSVSDLKGIDASVPGSKFKFISAGVQYYYFGNQTFGGVNTILDIEISNTHTSGASIYYSYLTGGSGTYTIKSLTINNGAYLTIGGSTSYIHTINVLENIVNNGTIQCYGNGYNNVINMAGSTAQSITGNGTWRQTGSGVGDRRFSGLSINNAAGVTIDQSFALSYSLYLTAGTISTSNGSVITLGTGVSSNLNIYVAGNPVGGLSSGAGGILPVNMTGYNLANVTFNIYYGNGASEYTTGGELPPGTLTNAESPVAGTMYMANSGNSVYSIVKLSRDATVAGLQIYNVANSILRLNGYNLRFSGSTSNSNTIYNYAATDNTMGLDASVSGSKLTFISAGPQDFRFGNQKFSNVETMPDVEVSNTNSSTGAQIYYSYKPTGNGTWNIKNLKITSGGYMLIGGSTSYYHTLNITGNIINNGTIMCYGNGYNNVINMNGSVQQSITGNGTWRQTGAGIGTGVFSGLGINNSAGVVLDQSITISTSLYLTAGTISTTNNSKITIGNAYASTLNTYIGGNPAGGTSSGPGAILPIEMTNYNLASMTYNIYYGNGATEYITAGELPPGTLTNAEGPVAGYMYMANSGTSVYSTVKLSRDATISGMYLYNAVNSILRLNGFNLRFSGNAANTNYIYNYAASDNTMGLDAGVSGSSLSFISAGEQQIQFGNQKFSNVETYPDVYISNTNIGFAANIYYCRKPTGNGTWNIKNLTVNSGSYLTVGYSTSYYHTVNVYGDLLNNGTIQCYGTGYNSIINMCGTTQQTVSGSGIWKQTNVDPGAGRFTGFGINNSSGVILNQSINLSNTLNLTSGSISTSNGSVITLGTGSGTLTCTRTNGAIDASVSTAFNLSNVTYNLSYNSASSAQSTGGELPPSDYYDYKAGTLTIANPTANGGVILNRSANINALTVSAGAKLDLNGKTIAIYSSGTYTNNGTIDATNINSTISFIGVAAQTLGGTLASNYSSNYISNIIINNPLGVSLTNSAMQIGSGSVNGSLTILNGFATLYNSDPSITIYGTVSCSTSGTITPGGSSGIYLRGSAGNMGNINLTGYLSGTAQTIAKLDVNITGINPQVTINGNLNISTTFTLTSGVVNMGNYAVNYTSTTTTPMLIANQNPNSYFAFNGTSSGLNWTMNSVAAGTYRWNIGYGVGNWRPITITTGSVASSPAAVKLGYYGSINGTSYSAYDIVSTGNIRSNYIATLNLAGNIGTPTITMEYQNTDFNSIPSAVSALKIWYYKMPAGSGTSQWTQNAQSANSTNGSNITISENSLALTSSGSYPLNLGETNNDPGNSTTTYIWTGGATSTAWLTPGNWNPSGPPTSGANVIIPFNASYPPTISTALANSVNDLTILSGGILSLSNGGSITIEGNLYNNNFNGTSNGFNCAASSTVTYTGTGKLIGPGNYNNLNFSGSTTPVLSSIGTIAVSGTFTPVNSGVTYTGSTINFNGSSLQTIPAFDFFNNVNFNNTTATNSIVLGGSIKIYGDMYINCAGFDDGTYLITGPGLGSGIMTVTAGRIYTARYTGSKAIPEFQTYNIYGTNASLSTFRLYGNNSGVQTIAAATFGHIEIQNGSTNKKTAAGNLTIKGNLTLTSGSFDDGGYIISINGNINNNVSTGSSSTGITSSGGGKILLTGAGSAHTLTSTATPINYGNLELNDGWGATISNTTGSSVTTITGNLTISSGTFTINNFSTSLSITETTSISNSGVLTHNNATGTKYFNNVINNGTWNESAAAIISVSGDFENNGLFYTSSGVHSFTGTNKEIRGTQALVITSVNITGSYTNKLTGSYTQQEGTTNFISSGGFKISTTFNGSGGTLTQGTNALLIISATLVTPSLVATASGNTVVYNGTSATSIKTPNGAGGPYYNLLINPNGGVAFNLTGAITINNNLTYYPSVSNSSFNDLTYLLTGPGVGTGTFNINSPLTSTINLTNTSVNPFPVFQNYQININNTVNYNGAGAQDLVNSAVSSISFGNLTIGASGNKTARQNITIKGNLTINTGTLADNGNTITVMGNVLGNSAHTSSSGGSITLSGGSNIHQLNKTNNFGNLTLNDPLGAIVVNTFTITGELKLSQGIFYLGNSITTTLSGTVSGTSTIAGYGTTSSLTIGGTGNLGTLTFEPGYTNLYNLTMSRTSSGELSLGSLLTINNTLNWSAASTGLIKLGNNDLIIPVTGTITTTNCSSTAMLVADGATGTGQLKKVFSGTTTFTYPVGDMSNSGIDYSPLTLTNFYAYGPNRTIGVKVTDAVHPEINSNQVQTNYLSRYWSITDDNPSYNYQYTGITLGYPSSDQAGTISTTNDQINRYDNTEASWYAFIPTTVANSTTATATALTFFTNTNATLNNNDITIRNNPPEPYTWTGTIDSDWQKAGNWTPSRDNPLVTDVLQFTNGATHTVTNVPTQTIQKLLIKNNSNVTLQAAGSNTISISGSTAIDNLLVEAGATLQIGSGTNTLTITFLNTGVSGQNANISGTLVLNNLGTLSSSIATTNFNIAAVTGSITVNTGSSLLTANTITTINGSLTNNGGTITSTAANLFFANGSYYNHPINGGTIPPATYYSNPTITSSNVNITGITTTNPSGLSGVFSNLIWNNTGQTSATGGISNAITINGNLTILSGTFYDSGYQITGNSTGTFTMAGGTTLNLANTGSNPFPLNFTTANISLNQTSNVNYNASAVQNVSSVPSSYGNLTIAGGNVRTATGNINVAGNLTISAGTLADGGYTISVNGNIINNATHSGTGKILLTGGAVAHSLTGSPANYGNIEFDDIQGANYSSTSTSTLSGNLTITRGNLNFGSFNSSLTVNGLTTIATNGTLTLSNVTGTKTFNGNIINLGIWNNTSNSPVTIAGSLDHSGNTFNSGTGLYSLTGSGKEISGSSALTITNATITTTGNYTNNQSAGLTIGTLTINANSGTLTLNYDLTINTAFNQNGTLYCGTNLIKGAGNFTLGNATTAYIYIGSPTGITTSGLSGNIQVSGSRTYGASANYIYYGSSTQLTGNGMTNANNLTINNSFNVKLSVNVIVSNILILTSGLLDLDNFNLSLTNTNNATAISGTPSVNNMIITNGSGQLIKTFGSNSTVPFIYPVGDNTGILEYTPATLTFSANSTGTVGIKLKNITHPYMDPSENYFNRYWSFTTSMSSYTYTLSMQYIDPEDITGDLSSINAAMWDGSKWTPYSATKVSGILTITIAPLNQLTASLNNTDYTGRETEIYCAEINGFLHETFLSSSMPSDWSSGIVQGSQNWIIRNSPTFGSASGGFYAVFDDWALGSGVKPNEAWIRTKAVDFCNLNSLKLSFYQYWYGVENTHGYVEVSFNSGANWTIIADNSGTTIGSQASPEKTIIDLSSLIPGQSNMIIRFRYTDGSQAGRYWFIDDINIYSEADVGISELVSPAYLNCSQTYSSSEQVTIRVFNYSYEDINNVNWTCAVSGGTSGSWSGTVATIPANSYVQVNVATIDMSADDVYHFIINASPTAPAIDGNTANNTLRAGRRQIVRTYPYTENFNTTTAGWFEYGTNPQPVNSAIPTHNGRKYSWGNLPYLAGAQGNGKSWYVETTWNGYSDQIWAESPVFDFSNLTNATLSMDIKYQLSTYNTQMQVTYTKDNGVNWYQLGDANDNNWYSGNLNWWYNNLSTPVNTWTHVERNLCELSGEPCVKFRIYGYAYYGISGGSDYRNYNYFAFDNFQISGGEQDDVQPLSMLMPVSGKCSSFTSSEQVKVLIKNNTCRPIVNLPISIKVDNNAEVNETVGGTIPRFGTYIYTFTSTANLSAAGSHTIIITTNLLTDGDVSNNILTETRNNLTPVTIASGGSYLENFNSGNAGWASNPGNETRYFRLGTVPYLNGAEGNGDSWYCQQTTNGNSGFFTAESPVFNLSNTVNPVLYMDIKYRLSTYSTQFHIEYSANGGTWTQLGTNASPNWYLGNTNWWYDNLSNPVDSWTKVQHSLCNILALSAAEKACVRFRIAGYAYYGPQQANNNLKQQTDYSNYNYFAFDNFEIADAPDVGVFALNDPNSSVSGCLYSSTQSVTISVRNFSCQSLTNVPVTCDITGMVTQTLTGTVPSLAANSTTTYTFPGSFDMTGMGTYNIHVYINPGYDTHANSDGINVSINVNYPKITSYPSVETFESNNGYWTASGSNPPANDGRNFVYGSLPYLNGPQGNGNSWYVLTTTNGSSTQIWAESPVYDFSLLSDPRLSMDIKYKLSTYNTQFQVTYSKDGGSNWYQLGTSDDANWYSGNINWWYNNLSAPVDSWTNVQRDLCQLAGEPCVKFRVSGYAYYGPPNADYNYFAFDNFTITGSTIDDIAPIAISQPNARNCSSYSSTETVQVLLTNYLCRPIYNIPLTLKVDGNTIATETAPGPIDRFNSYYYTFTAKANLSDAGEHTIEVITGLASDIIPANNTLTEKRYNNKIASYPYINDFDEDNEGWVSYSSTSTRYFVNAELPYLNGAAGKGKSWYVEPKTNGNSSFFYVESPVFDLSLVNDPSLMMEIKYKLSSYSTQFHVEYSDNGGAWTQLGTSSDPYWYVGNPNWWYNNYSAPIDTWTTVQHTLSSLKGKNCIKFRISGYAYYGPQPANNNLRPQTDYSDYNYFAFDNFRIVDAVDVGVSQILTPDLTAIGCLYSANQSVRVRVYNWSSSSVSEIPVQCVITFPDASQTTLTGVVSSIPFGSYTDYTFSGTFNMLMIGTYKLEASTQIPGDPNPANDGTTVNYNLTWPKIYSYPYIEDFESNNGYWLASGGAPPANNGRNFVCGNLPYLNGPQGNGKSWYIETTTNGYSTQIWVESPVFDFSALTSPTMSMDIKYKLSTYNTQFHVEYSTNGGGTWTQLGTESDPDWYKGNPNWWYNNLSSPVDSWTHVIHNLCSFAGMPCVKFRISGYAYYGPPNADYNYFALDNFKIEDNYRDIAISSFVTPVSAGIPCTFSPAQAITVKVQSISCSTLNNVPVYCNITGPYNISYNLSGNVTVPANGTVNYTFPVTVDLRSVGTWNFDAWTDYTGDSYINNDHKLQTLVTLDTLIKTFPYYANFNNSNQYWRSGNSVAPVSQTRNFVRGTFDYLRGNEEYGKSWYVNTTTNGSSEAIWVESPILDFSTVQNPRLSFEIKYQLSTYNTQFHVEYSTDGGLNYTQLGTSSDPQWYSGNVSWWYDNYSNPIDKWTYVEHNLCNLKGQSCVKLRINGYAYYGLTNKTYNLFAFDNINITDDMLDAELTNVNGCYGSTYKMQATIKNKNNFCSGYTPPAITSVNLSYSVDGEVHSGTYSVNIAAGASGIVEIPNVLIPNGLVMEENLATGGTATASHIYAGSSASAAFDNNLATTGWANTSVNPSWLKYDFGAGNAKVVNVYNIYCSSTQSPGTWNNEVYNPGEWQFQGSNDNSNWTTLDYVYYGNLSMNIWKTFSFNNITPYRYYRIYNIYGEGSNYIRITELQLFNVTPTPSRVKVWQNNPNGLSDNNHNNDTIRPNLAEWVNCNDHCSNAIELQENMVYATQNNNASVDLTEDPGFGACTPTVSKENTVWYYFTTNCNGGETTLTFKNINCAPSPTGIQISIDRLNPGGTECNPLDYTNVFCSNNNNQNDVVWTATDLPPNTKYYITTDGIAGNQCTFQIELNGAIDLLTPATGISKTNDNSCPAVSKSLTPIGGFLTPSGNWKWYADAQCLTPVLFTGSPYEVSPSVTTEYWVRAEDACEVTDAISTVVTVKEEVTINTNPINKTVYPGENTILEVSGSGTAPLSYQWQLSTDGGNIFTDITTAGSDPTYSGYNEDILNINIAIPENDGYRYRCIVSNECDDATSNVAILTVLSGIPGLWAGRLSTDWNTAANWDDYKVPTSTVDVTIPSTPSYQPLIDALKSGVCNNITINSKASLTVEGSLDVKGDMLIKSDATGSGGFLNKAGSVVDIEGDVTVEKYLAGAGYHYLGSPIKDATFNDMSGANLVNLTGIYYNPDKYITAAQMPNVWKMEEPHTHNTAYDMNGWKASSGKDDPIETMRGYAVIFSNPVQTINIKGAGSNLHGIDNIDLSYGLTRSQYSMDTDHNNIKIDMYGKTSANGINYGTGPANGWHLLCNPYPSALDWTAVYDGNGIGGDISRTITFFKPTSQYGGIYGYYNGYLQDSSGAFKPSRFIPSMQAFYINNTDVNNDYHTDWLTFKNSFRTVSKNALGVGSYKSNKEFKGNIGIQSIKLRAYINENYDFGDETVIYFIDGTDNNYDKRYDALKLLNTDPRSANIYTIINDKNYAVKSFDGISETMLIPIVISANTEGEIKLELSEERGLAAGINIYLEDEKQKILTNLSQNPEYIINTNGSNNKYYLRISKEVMSIEEREKENFRAFASNNILNVIYDSQGISEGILSLYDATGKEVMIPKTIRKGSYTYKLSYSPGIYYIKFISNNTVYLRKILIE